MESLELLILQNLIYNQEFHQKVIPYITDDVFPTFGYRIIAKIIRRNYDKNKEIPTIQLLKSQIDSLHKLTDQQRRDVELAYDKVAQKPEPQPIKTLIDVAQQHFRQCLIEKNLAKAADEFEENNHARISGQTIKDLEDSTNFSFDPGDYYNYLGEFENRIEQYGEENKRKYQFPLRALNDCTNGGMNPKSLSIVMASTGGGKSIFLCNAATHLIQQGFNVLYVTCEMSVQEIAKRIDANLLDVTQDAITRNLERAPSLRVKMDQVKDKDKWGQLYIKEYPAGYATAGIITRDIEEIERTFDKKVDVLVVDYLNLLNTSRYSTKTATSYTLIKAIAEELRGIGQAFDIPVLSATQSNRSALNKDTKVDAGLEAVSDSYGLPQTADFMFNIIAPDVWKPLHYRLFKILKNRWGDPNKEFIKVYLRTEFARFTDVDGWDVAIGEKPMELLNVHKDESGGILNPKDVKSVDKPKPASKDGLNF